MQMPVHAGNVCIYHVCKIIWSLQIDIVFAKRAYFVAQCMVSLSTSSLLRMWLVSAIKLTFVYFAHTMACSISIVHVVTWNITIGMINGKARCGACAAMV